VGLAQAILHQPKLLILDEPTVGLDPTQIVEIRHLIRRLAAHTTILFSSHILSEVQALCDRVLILVRGELKADARIAELAATGNTVLILGTAPEGAKAKLAALPGVEGVEPYDSPDRYPAFRIRSEADLGPQIYALARAENWDLRELRRDSLTLETIFNQLATAG
jgi:ABC-2 type transport system ATP-binding protein